MKDLLEKEKLDLEEQIKNAQLTIDQQKVSIHFLKKRLKLNAEQLASLVEPVGIIKNAVPYTENALDKTERETR